MCTFTVAVNRRFVSQNPNQPEADFFKVSAWDKLGENCQKYLAKGRKVSVIGAVSVSSYEAKDGTGKRFSLDVRAEDVEFLSAKSDAATPACSDAKEPSAADGFTEVADDDLPF